MRHTVFRITHNYGHVYLYQLIVFIHTVWHNSLMGEILTDLRLCWVSVKIFPVNIFHQQLEQLDTAHKVDIEYWLYYNVYFKVHVLRLRVPIARKIIV